MSSDVIQHLFREEEKRSEKLVNYARIGLSLMYIGAVLSVRKEIPTNSVIAGFAAGGISLLYSFFLYWYLKGNRYTPRIKYISTTLDIVIVSIAIGAFGTFRTFKTSAFPAYFLWISLAAMRFSTRLTIFAGVLSTLLYLGVVSQGILRDTVELGTITDSFTTEKVSLLNVVLKVIFMISVSITATYVAQGYHRLVTRSVKEQLEKNQVRDAFSRYVTQQVADKVLDEGINLKGELRQATVLFCDIREFTRMSSDMGAVEVVNFLNEYLSLMIDVIFEYQGTLDKFVGDEIMAVFGVPVKGKDDSLRAVQAAVKMRRLLADLNDRRARDDKEAINFGIGIHTGEVIAGNIGSEKRMEYTVIGQTVNLASRIESLNKVFSSDILISEATYELVKNNIVAEKQKMARLKGINEPIKTYKVIQLAES